MLSNRAILSAATLARRQAPAQFQRRMLSENSKKVHEIFPDTEFLREREAVKHHARETSELWRKLSYYVVPAVIVLGGINAYNLWNEHWEHEKHMPPLEERVEYPYQNIRSKNFFWGDGDKSLL
ncbi:Cytochrome c oxidase subunit 6A, mitochondrial [Ascosphaera atra]|nr:Cytochrome c oxidase subunit 6A, mitochondrial [Ascosphaera atra]